MLEKDEKGSLCHLAHVQSKQIMYGTRGPPREQKHACKYPSLENQHATRPALMESHGIVLTSDVKVSPTA